jgi:hypothetical protein
MELAERDLFEPIHDIFLSKGYQVWITHDSTELGSKNELSKHIDRVHLGSGLLEGDVRKF